MSQPLEQNSAVPGAKFADFIGKTSGDICGRCTIRPPRSIFALPVGGRRRSGMVAAADRPSLMEGPQRMPRAGPEMAARERGAFA